MNDAVYLVLPLVSQVAAEATALEIAASSVTIWLELREQTAFAEQDLPSVLQVYVGVPKSWPRAGMSTTDFACIENLLSVNVAV